MAVLGTAILVVVALVGVWLNLAYHAKMLPLPKGPVVVHGIAAVVAFVLLLMAAGVASAEQPQQLHGRWRALETRVQMPDGVSTKQAAACTAEYTQDKTITECDMGEGQKNRVVARLYNVTASTYEIEVTEAPNAPRAVGMKNKVDYRIEGNRLTVSAKPVMTNAPASRIETTMVRE
jgi:hypothetical protein